MPMQFRTYLILFLCQALLLLTSIPSIQAQQNLGGLSGTVSDSTGALIPNAQIALKAPDGTEQSVAADGLGRYTFARLSPGQYLMRVSAEGFSVRAGIVVNIAAGRAINHDVQLEIAMVEQRVEVLSDSIVDVEPTSNASALTLSGSSLQTLSDDPDELAQDLQMLAGPSAGPGGGELFVDGFSGAKLPPKSAIREVRVNQNPFSAEYDRLGYGRVEILTKPGAGNLHGDARFIFNDDIFNSRNPFAPDKPDYQRRIYEGTLTGPIKRNTSFTFQFERRNIGQAALINALILDDALNVINFREAVLNPRTNTELSGRIDHQLSPNHTLVGRYEWEKNYLVNAGLDTYSMPTRAFNTDEREQVLQLTETALLSPRLVNEVKFQYRRSHDAYDAANSDPAVQVPDAFTSGGTSAGLNSLVENRYELQELLSWSAGKNMVKAGGRFRAIDESNAEADNYNGMFTFNTLDAYQITEAGLQSGLTPEEIRAQGGGASQFTMSAGDPLASVTQYDIGLFVQDDWRIRDNLTLSAGLRFEKQTNINDWSSWGPRLGFAWGIPSGSPNRPFAVLRAGFGAFYERIRENLVLDTKRLDGVHQQSYFIPNPDFYPSIPDPAILSNYAQDQAIRKLSPILQAPDTQQFVLSLEKQFPRNTTASASYMHSNGIDMLRSRNINAPLEQTGLRPFPGPNVYAYESNGRFQQDQLIANANARISSRLNLFGYYTWSRAHSDTDGAQTFPSYTYDLAAEYSRAGFDVEQRAMIGGTLTSPLLGILFNPFVVMHSGEPFNIVAGPDLNGDSIFTDRPAFATDPSLSSVIHTEWGDFDTQPSPGQPIIPRNLGGSPGMWVMNLRVSRAFGFGEGSGGASLAAQGGPQMGAGPGGGPGGGHYHGSDATAVGRRYSLTVSASARNLLNHVNLNTPVGNLSSPLFGTSTSTHGFGPGSASANRTIDFGLFFSF
jgi:hypothetical protein